MKYMIKISALMVATLLYACSSTKEPEKKEPPKKYEKAQEKVVLTKTFNKGLYSIDSDGEIEFAMPALSNSADFKLRIAGRDSLSMTIHGPLGITVAKLFATPTKFQFLNSFNGELFEGTPSEENFRKIANIPLCYTDLICILTSQLANSADKYTLIKTADDMKQYSYGTKEYTDVVYLPADFGHIHYLSRFSKVKTPAEKVYEVYYKDFTKIGSFVFGKKINMKFPTMDGKIDIEFDKIETNVKFEKPFRFKISDGVKRYNMDKK